MLTLKVDGADVCIGNCIRGVDLGADEDSRRVVIKKLDGQLVYLRDSHHSDGYSVLGRVHFREEDRDCYEFGLVTLEGSTRRLTLFYNDLESAIEITLPFSD